MFRDLRKNNFYNHIDIFVNPKSYDKERRAISSKYNYLGKYIDYDVINIFKNTRIYKYLPKKYNI
jgi:hypothetical protein